MLGDVGESAPEHWEFGGPDTPEPHLLLLVYTADAAALAELVGELAGAAAKGGLEQLQRLDTSDIGRAEHFGFRDGISQPRIAGIGKAPPSDDQVVRAGELVLGYRDEYGLYADRPLVAAQHDPGWCCRRTSRAAARTTWAETAATWCCASWSRTCPRSGGSPTGRRARTGSGWRRRWWAAGRAARRWCWRPMRTIPASSATLNAFRYHRDDPLGRSCPVASHIRRTNPRESLDPDPGSSGSLAVGKHHRIMRRGRSYGTRLTIEQALAGGDGRRRGLYFMCLNTNVARQFEFIQQTWANSPKFAGLYDEPDPLLAPSGSFSMPADPVRRRVTGVPRFVTVRGGAYFMLPSLRAVRYLSGLHSPSTEG